MKIFLRHRHALMISDGAVNKKIYYVIIFWEILNPKGHYWFKSYGNFAEWVVCAHWWSSIGKGLRLEPAQQACFFCNC